MSTHEIQPEQFEARDYRLLLQELRETCERARLGGFFYPLAVGLGFLVTTREYLVPAIALTVWFTMLAALRLAIRVPDAPDYRRVKIQLGRLWSIVLVTNFCWGAFSAWSFLVLPEPAPLISVLFSGAFGMALAHSLCMRRLPCALGILAVMLPSLVLLWRGTSSGVGVMWAIYTIYMLLVLMRSYREYRARLELEADLREQRNLFEIQSRTDVLTGIFNRRTFASALARSLEFARKGGSISLLILDIDFFKNINDTHGHLAGDDCLVAMAQRMRKHFSEPDDTVGRLGGEEFGVVMHCNAVRAHQRAERFRLDLESTPLAFEGGDAPATVSIGCGCFDVTRHASSEVLYREVDAALYKAKLEGRNRTVCIGAMQPVPAGVAPAG